MTGSAATMHDFDLEALDHCPFMPVFGAPEIMFERGQGTELWDLSYVDPDNRRPVDFELRKKMLTDSGKQENLGAEAKYARADRAR